MDINDILKLKNLKITKGRKEILEIFLTSKDLSLSAEEVFEVCKKNGGNINLSTVYRTLEIFCEKELLDKFILENSIYVYKLHKKSHKHVLQCDVCHKEVEVPCPLRQIEEIVKEKTGFTLTEHSLKMKGVCDNCKK